MFIRKQKLAYLLCVLLSLMPLSSVHARAEGTADNATSWYFDYGVSAFVVDLPKYAPLWNFSGINAGSPFTDGSRETLMDGTVIVAPLIEATMGKEFAHYWFAEARLEFANILTRSRQYKGDYDSDNGIAYCPFDGVSSELRGSSSVAKFSLNLSLQQYGADLVVGKTYGWDHWHLRPFAGYWFQQTDMTYGMAVINGDETDRVSEKLQTSYNGLLVGIQWAFPIKSWQIELETTYGVAWAHTHYRGLITENDGDQNDLYLDARKHAYRGTLQATVSIPVEVGCEFNIICGLGYMSYVPRIIASGQANNADFGSGPTHLESESSFSGNLGVSLSYSF